MNITGFEDALKLLEGLSNPGTAEEALRRGFRRGGKIVQGTAKTLCPVDTGQLRNSIVVTDLADGVDVGTNTEYAPYVEYGTGPLGDPAKAHTTREKWVYHDGDGFKTGYPQPPRPFIHPAAEAHKQDVKAAVINAINEELRRHG